MDWAAWMTLAIVAGMVGTLIFSRLAADAVFLGAVTVLMISGIITPKEAFSGFGNEGLITVGVLCVVAVALEETGGIHWLVQNVLRKPFSFRHALWRTMAPTAVFSAFLNNTPQVSMMIPAINSWAKKFNLPASKLLLPMNYATILGGTCALIGTSTNLVISSMLIGENIHLSLFSIAPVGIPVAIVGILFLLFFTDRLLPDRRPTISQLADPREYSVEMLVEAAGPLVGQTIEQAGLRHLPGLYLAEIDRTGQILAAVSPQETLQAGDRLLFVGIVDSVVELQKIHGLVPATEQVFKLDGPRSGRCLVEAVVSGQGPLSGKSIRDIGFRRRYNAVVIAVARSGQRLDQKIGDIELERGDTLLLEARPNFFEEHRNSRHFLLVRRIEDSSPPRHDHARRAILIMLGMVLSAAFGIFSMLEAALLAAGLMIATGCVSPETARRSIDWPTLIVIGASFGLSAALEKTGAARAVTETLLTLTGPGPISNLVMIYVVTAVMTNIITNNAAAALMFPFAVSVANNLEVSLLPFGIAIMMGASAAYATPMGYQTNLMVMGPGGYRFIDYLRLGLPLTFITSIVTLLLIPRIWAF
ncbi:MAG: SLC13 family permease [Pseudomonadota bacterium]|nr:SLC13 family permease [Pseudomonadota bacterium]